VSPSAKFCPECAQPTGRRVSTHDRQPFGSPEEYTPKHLAERIINSKAAVEGERKQVTVLFADLKGSMELLADRDPEDARKILDPVLKLMIEAVHSYEGTVNQIMGDGIMALFGAPLAHEDHAVRACFAALHMQQAVKRHAEEVRRVEGVPIHIRVGLNSGEVVVRAISSNLHMDYTAVGQTTHLAARMEQLADPGSVLLTSAVLAMSEDFVQVKPLGPMKIKGLSEMLSVYELTAANDIRSRFRAHAARGLTKFVGRAAETAQLGDAMDFARRGRGQIVAVVGEAGVGKSRLFWEFSHSHHVRDCTVVQAAAASYGRASTYLPVKELLRDYFAIGSVDDARVIKEKVTGKLLSLDRTLESVLPAVLALLDLSVSDAEWTNLDPPVRRIRTFDALKRLLFRECAVQPVVVIFEDLHWIDSETQTFLDSLVEKLAATPLLLLVNYRPEYQHVWGGKTYYRQVRLDTLASANADELLEALLGDDAQLPQVKKLLIQRTDGNPFFIEESVRMLVETGVLVGIPGHFHLTRTPDDLRIPATAQAILAARIDRLAPEDKRVLQEAAVVGKDVPYALLQRISDASDSLLEEALTRLQAGEFLYETRLFPAREYTFKHALTQEVAFAGLTTQRRRELDVAVVECIERFAGERLREHIERLAHHAFRGEAWTSAAKYLEEAADKAASKAAFRQSIDHLKQALTAVAKLEPGRESLQLFVDINIALRGALTAVGDLDGQVFHSSEALTAARELADDRRIARSATALAYALFITGRARDAEPLGRQALQTARTLNDPTLRLGANLVLGGAAWALASYRNGREYLEENISLTRDVFLSDAPGRSWDFWRIAGMSRAWLVLNLVDIGDLDRAATLAVELNDWLDRGQRLLLMGKFVLPWTQLARGEFAKATPLLEQGLGICRATDNLGNVPPYLGALGRAYCLAGRYDEALNTLQEALTLAERHNRANRSLWCSFQSETYLLSGQTDAAIDSARRGLAGAKERGERGEEACNLYALARAEGKAGDYLAALAYAQELGMQPLTAHCHFGLAELYRSTAEAHLSRQHAGVAAAMYREMDMDLWLDKAVSLTAQTS
jgi:class 3 adenylate cyclase/tetratricopeptide (TPR) repeat protein